MKKIKIKIPISDDMSYYYSHDKLSEADMEEKKKLEDRLCKLVNILEIGVRNSCRYSSSSRFITVKKEKDYVIITIQADDADITELSE